MLRMPIAIVTSLVTVTLAGCQAEEPRAHPPARPVSTVTVEPQALPDSVTLTGFIAAQVESNLSFRTSGQIIEQLVDVGDRVNRGQILARIDPKVQQADVASARAAAESASADVEQATSAFERSRSLFEQGYTTRREFDVADQALKVAKANAISAAARLQSAEEALSFTDLTAEADGIVTARQLDTGEVAQAAATVFTVAIDGPRDAVFDIYERLLLSGSEPPQVTVALAADPAVKATGRIRQVSPTIDQRSGTVRVRIGLAESPEAMTLGAAVVGTAALPAAEVVVIPAVALTSHEGRAAVWVLDPGSGEVQARPVTVHSYQASNVTVSSGLSRGDQVVVEGTKLLRPGERIVTANEEASPQ